MAWDPYQQIVLLAGLEDAQRRDRIWATPQLQQTLEGLAPAFVDHLTPTNASGEVYADVYTGLSTPSGFREAIGLRDDGRLLDELLKVHLPGIN